MILDFLYNISLNPLITTLEALFLFLFELTNSYGLAIILLSIVLNFTLKPIVNLASKKEKKISEIEEKISKKTQSIKKAFKGEEQVSMLKTLYRQNNYNPFYSFFRNTSLLIQIPFFIALFILLSDYSKLDNQSFLFIDNLLFPDALLFNINILPILMLLISLLATYLQNKRVNNKSKKIYILPIFFFILVYNMPSILLLYWITNNIFYIFPKKDLTAKPKKLTSYIYASFIVFLFLVVANYSYLPFILFVKYNNFYIFTIYLLMLSFLLTFIIKALLNIAEEKSMITSISTNNKLFYILLFTLLFYLYFVFTSFFISSEDIIMFGEFFIKQLYLKAFIYFFVSFIIFYILYISFDSYKKKILFIILNFLTITFLINAFFINYDFGLLDTFIFPFSNKLNTSIYQILFNIFTILLIFIFSYILIKRFQKHLIQVMVLINIAGFITLFLNFSDIKPLIKKQEEELKKNTSEKIFHYSKKHKNIVIIMLDRASAGFVPDIFKDEIKLKSVYEGFDWYANTLSSSNNTLGGLQTIYGGENYKIDTISSYKPNISLKEKRDNAYKLYIDNFTKKNYELLYFAPTLAGSSFNGDCSIFNNKELQCYNTFRTNISEHNLKSERVISKIYKQLAMLSLFKGSPLILKKTIYQEGFWLGNSAFQVIATNLYKTHKDNLTMLKKLSDTKAKKNTFKIITNLLTHSPSFTDEQCNASTNVDEDLIKRFKNKESAMHYQSMKCSMKILADYFQWFKDNNIYDNTMFVIVSDHAYPLYNPMLNKAFGKVDYTLSYYHSLLMVKPFNAKGLIKRNLTPKMNYEVPYMVCNEIGGCYDKFFNKNIEKSKLGKKVKVFDTPWLFEGQNIDSYNINKIYEFEFPFNESNTEKL